jgi:inositol-hexakisphosphate kinase
LLHDIPNVSEFASLGEHGQDIAAAGQSTTFSRPDDQPRIVSHSQNILPLPEVILENNRHIIPANLFQARPRPSTPSAQLNNPSLLTQLRRADQTPEQPTIAPPSESPDASPARPAIKQHGSWGATTVNRKLQEQVLREVFTAPPIHRHRRHERSHGVSSRRSRLVPTGGLATAHRSSTDISQLHHAFADLNDNAQEQAHSDQGEHLSMPTPLPAVHDAFAGRSDQAMPDSAGGSRSSSVASRPQRRRHSGGGLRRRPFDIDSGVRTDLEFHEE